jgi:hypothetical protein
MDDPGGAHFGFLKRTLKGKSNGTDYNTHRGRSSDGVGNIYGLCRAQREGGAIRGLPIRLPDAAGKWHKKKKVASVSEDIRLAVQRQGYYIRKLTDFKKR